MQVITFFSAKGGTCKTTMNMMFASFLKYHLGKRVLLLDFDSPEFNLSNVRRRDLRGSGAALFHMVVTLGFTVYMT